MTEDVLTLTQAISQKVIEMENNIDRAVQAQLEKFRMATGITLRDITVEIEVQSPGTAKDGPAPVPKYRTVLTYDLPIDSTVRGLIQQEHEAQGEAESAMGKAPIKPKKPSTSKAKAPRTGSVKPARPSGSTWRSKP